MCFDYVVNENRKTIHSALPDRLKRWIKDRLDDEEVQKSQVCLGTTLTFTSIENYIKNA